jgi:MbtH protein
MNSQSDGPLDDRSIDGDLFVVLRNDEDQYSLWPAAKPAPDGWTVSHPAASKADCLAHVESLWTDMRPRSLREAMDRDAADRAGE